MNVYDILLLRSSIKNDQVRLERMHYGIKEILIIEIGDDNAVSYMYHEWFTLNEERQKSLISGLEFRCSYVCVESDSTTCWMGVGRSEL